MGKEEKLRLELEDTQKVLKKKLYKMRVLRNELHATKNELRLTQRTLYLTNDKLKDALKKIRMMKQATDDTVSIMRDYLFQKEGKYKGNPLRTHAGGSWLDGYSDHLPSVVYVIKEVK